MRISFFRKRKGPEWILRPQCKKSIATTLDGLFKKGSFCIKPVSLVLVHSSMDLLGDKANSDFEIVLRNLFNTSQIGMTHYQFDLSHIKNL